MAKPWQLTSGDMVDHFRVVRPVDRGGMAEVYLARDTMLGRKVALKVIQPGVFSSSEAADRFLLEARTTAKFNHPNIVTIHTVGRHRGQPYLALEFLEGETLRDRLAQEQPGTGECLRWASAIADALAEAHAGGVLHRDLKPANVLLARDGRLRVLDFGLARPMAQPEVSDNVDYETGRTVRGSEGAADTDGRALLPGADPDRGDDPSSPTIKTAGTSGTPTYMAPEQWTGRNLSGAADVWALGVILYEMLVGRRPFAGAGAIEEVRLTRGPDPVAEPELSAAVPKDVVAAMMRCLEKDASKRPSAAEVRAVLDGALEVERTATGDGENPFRGLLPFNESHRHMFFGRDGEIGAFVERLREVPVLAIVGPSGAGKSSFVRAGVIPRMREGASLTTIDLRPGARPFDALARRLVAAERGRSGSSSSLTNTEVGGTVDDLAAELEASPTRLALLAQNLAEARSGRVLIFVDQMEELYTLVPDPEIRGRFLRALVAAADDPDGPVRVVLTVREEFLSRLAEGPELREALAHITILRSPGADQLREILTRPVSRAGYAYDEPGLVDRMLDEVAGELSSLPLLQFAGLKLWEGRDRERRLLLESVYDRMGGVAGALATHADGVLAGLTDRQVGLARTMLLRLVTPEGTRRVATRSQVLQDLPESSGEVLDRLVGGRLVTVRRASRGDDADLELVHESLLVAWKRLARWLDGSHEEREFLAEIGHAADLWQRRGHRAAELWRGEALRDAEATVKRLELDLPTTARRFLDAGRQREDQSTRRRRIVTAAVFSALVAIAVMLGVQRHEARTERDRAQRGQAEALREGARAAWLQGDVFEARCKLRRSLEILDSAAGRALWWRLEGDPLRWRDPGDALHYQVAFSADGSRLATSGVGAVTVFDARTREAHSVAGVDGPTLGVAFSPDGRLLAAGSYNGDVLVWTLADGSMRRFSGHGQVPWFLVFSPDGNELVSASYDTTIRIWDVATGQTRATLEGHTERIRRVRLSPDGRTLASGSYDGTIRLWDLPTAAHLKTLGADGAVLALAWNDDGSRIVSGGSDGPTVQLWDVPRGEALATLDVGHTAGIESLDFSPDGRLVASGSRDWTVRVWDPSGAVHRVFDGAEGEIHVARFSPDADFIAVTSADKGLRLWNLEPPARPAPISGHTKKTYRAAFSPDGAMVATSSEDETVRLWDLRTGEVVRVITGHASDLYDLDFSPDGRMLATTGADRAARLWDPISGELLRVLRGHGREVLAAAFAPDGRLATAGVDGAIRFWDPATGTMPAGPLVHGAAVIDLDFDPTGRFLASAGYDAVVRVWDTSTMREIHALAGHEGNVYGVRFSPDGRHLLTTGHDGTLRRWTVSTGESRIVKRFEEIPYFLDINDDDGRVVVPLLGGRVFLFDREAAEWTELGTRGVGATGAVFSPDGALLATTGGSGGALLVTDLTDRRPSWRAPALLTDPPLLLTHLGWRELEPGATDRLPAEAAWRTAVETRARLASQSDDGRMLCLTTWNGAFELWDVAGDRVIFTDTPPTVERLAAIGGGCLTLTDDGVVRLVRDDATFT
ncbi:MAG: protein kinase, partial [Candidatus Sulfomarinibacteraceae bacterium]